MLSCVFNLPKHNQKKPLSEKLHLYPGRLCHQTKEKYMNIYERKCIYKIFTCMYIYIQRESLFLQAYKNIIIKKNTKQFDRCWWKVLSC
jgi:hypothetical protein